MADVKWIKLSTDLFDNRKIKAIRKMPDGDSLLVIWLSILVVAGETNDRGYVYFTKDIPYTDELLADQFDEPLNTVRLALEVFERFRMIEKVDNVILVSNWEKYQNIDGLEKIREQNRIRQARWKEKQKLLPSNVTDNVTVTDSNATDKTKKRLDKDKSISNYESEFETLWSLYPKKQGKVNAFKSYIKARKDGTTFEQVKDGIGRYKRYIESKKTEEKYIKQGSTWFSQRCWDDDYTVKNGFKERTYDYADLEERLINK